MTTLMEVKNIYKTYHMGGESLHALQDVSFSVEQGDFISIVGPSGSGKSTMMNLLGCLDTPSSGDILLQGHAISSRSSDELASLRNRYIGFVFQQFNLLKRTSALENVILPLLYSDIPEEQWQKRGVQALTQVGLSERMQHMPSQLSGGQQQRVAIARALCNQPEILLADEPTGALDSRTSEEIMQLFRALNQEGKTVIIVTHEQEIAEQAQRILRFRDGRLESEGKGK